MTEQTKAHAFEDWFRSEPAFSALLTQGAPAFAVQGAPFTVIYANRAALALFSVHSATELTAKLEKSTEQGARRLRDLVSSMPKAAPRLERLRFSLAHGADLLTFICRKADHDGAEHVALAVMGLSEAELTRLNHVEAAPEPQPAPEPVAQVVAPVVAKPAVKAVQRFLFQTDASGEIVQISPEFAQSGLKDADMALGTYLDAIAPDPHLAAALAARQTWRNLEIEWPLADDSAHVPVTLSASPILDGAKNFTGFRGFGLVHFPRVKAAEAPVAAAEPAPVTAPLAHTSAAHDKIAEHAQEAAIHQTVAPVLHAPETVHHTLETVVPAPEVSHALIEQTVAASLVHAPEHHAPAHVAESAPHIPAAKSRDFLRLDDVAEPEILPFEAEVSRAPLHADLTHHSEIPLEAPVAPHVETALHHSESAEEIQLEEPELPFAPSHAAPKLPETVTLSPAMTEVSVAHMYDTQAHIAHLHVEPEHHVEPVKHVIEHSGVEAVTAEHLAPLNVETVHAQAAHIADLHVDAAQKIHAPSLKLPKLDVPETHVPEVRIPEVHIPEVHAPEVHRPEVHLPEVHAPEVNLPEVHLPELKVPEPHLSEVHVPVAHAPEHHVPLAETVHQASDDLAESAKARLTPRLQVPPTFEKLAEQVKAEQGKELAPEHANVVSLNPSKPFVNGGDQEGVLLSTSERSAFREIARALGARIEEDAAKAGKSPVQPATEHRIADISPQVAPPEPIDVYTPAAKIAEPVAPLPVAPAQKVADYGLAQNSAALLDRLPMGVLVSRGNVPIFANKTFLELLGYADADQFHAEDGLSHLFATPQQNLSADRPTMALHTRSGDVLHVDAQLQSINWNGDPASLLALRRQTEPESSAKLKGLELDLRARENEARELHAILDTATDGIVVVDDKGLILELNRSAEALLGYEQSEVLAQPLTVLLAPESHAAALDYLDGLKSNGVASVLNDGRDVMGRERQGRAVPLFMTLGRVGQGSNAKFCAVLRDVTHWKKAERELTDARKEAERTSLQKSDFLAKISHEIRTPLNAILGFTEVIWQERFGPIGNERYKDYLKDIHASGTHVMSLVNDLLDLSKIESGNLELDFTSVNANKIVQDCVALMQPQATKDRVIIRVSLAPRLPNIVCDERSLKQIVINLLSNAVKFNDPGGQVIVSTALTDAGHAVIRVRDTGIGMNDTDIERALEPFRQLETSRKASGTGLGLPLTKAMVEANRASFTIKSKRGEGTLVEVMFPPTRVLAE